MLITWFVTSNKDTFRTAVMVYVCMCHVIGVFLRAVANEKVSCNACCCSTCLLSKSKVRLPQRNCCQIPANQLTQDNDHGVSSAIDGIDNTCFVMDMQIDTEVEFVGDGQYHEDIGTGTKKVAVKEEPKQDAEPLCDEPNKYPTTCINVQHQSEIGKKKHIGSFDVVKALEKDIAIVLSSQVSEESCANDLSNIQAIIDALTCDLESSNSRNTNTVLSSVPSTCATNGTTSDNTVTCTHCSNSRHSRNVSKKRLKHKHLSVKQGSHLGNTSREPLWSYEKVASRNTGQLERRWSSVTSCANKKMTRGATLHNPNYKRNICNPSQPDMHQGNNREEKVSKYLPPKDNPKQIVKSSRKPRCNIWSRKMNALDKVLPSRKSQAEKPSCRNLELDWDYFLTDDSTTDYASMPPSDTIPNHSLQQLKPSKCRLLNSIDLKVTHLTDGSSTSRSSSIDYYDLELSTDQYDSDSDVSDSDYGGTWTWPPGGSKARLNRSLLYEMLPKMRISPHQNVTKWLQAIPQEVFV